MAAVLLLLGWWQWWGLLWVCLAPLARLAPAAAAAAAGQGQCEVLDPNIQSSFSLPTNLTVKPTAPGWLLDFAVREKTLVSACVRLRETESKVQVMLFKGDCDQGAMEKYNYLPGASVPPRAWTTLALDVKGNTVIVKAPNSVSIPLKADRWSLPRDALHVTVARGVEAAVGCRVNCPLYRHPSEGPDKKKTVKKSCLDDIIFYFRPGEEFVRLEYEVTCTTTEGTKEFLPITDIVPPDYLPSGLWVVMDLQHLDGEVEVRRDYKLLKKEKLPKGCTFTEHTIRLVGDSHFSFFCNPSTGEVEGVEDDSWYCFTNTECTITRSPTLYQHSAVIVTIAVFLGALILFLLIMYFIKKERNRKKNTEIFVDYIQASTLSLKPSPQSALPPSPPSPSPSDTSIVFITHHRITTSHALTESDSDDCT